MHRVHVPGAAPPSVRVSDGDAHHLTRVLRLDNGDRVLVFDGRGREWVGRITAGVSKDVTIELIEPHAPAKEPPAVVTLVIGLLKGDQMDAVVRDATALGVAHIRPVRSTHVAVSDRAARERSVERWMRVASASARQCGRAVVPDVHPVAPLTEALVAASARLVLACVEPARGGAAWPGDLPREPSVVIAVGPEGGWSDGDLDVLAAAGARRAGLGPRTLRAETAPVVALSALWTAWGWP